MQYTVVVVSAAKRVRECFWQYNSVDYNSWCRDEFNIHFTIRRLFVH